MQLCLSIENKVISSPSQRYKINIMKYCSMLYGLYKTKMTFPAWSKQWHVARRLACLESLQSLNLNLRNLFRLNCTGVWQLICRKWTVITKTNQTKSKSALIVILLHEKFKIWEHFFTWKREWDCIMSHWGITSWVLRKTVF